MQLKISPGLMIYATALKKLRIYAKAMINISTNYCWRKANVNQLSMIFLKSRNEEYELSAKCRTQMNDGYDFSCELYIRLE